MVPIRSARDYLNIGDRARACWQPFAWSQDRLRRILALHAFPDAVDLRPIAIAFHRALHKFILSIPGLFFSLRSPYLGECEEESPGAASRP